MVKYLIVACGILSALCAVLYTGYTSRGKEITRLDTLLQAVETEKEEYKNAQIASSELVKTLRLKVVELNDNDTVDCFNVVMPGEYRQLLDQLK